MILVSWTPEGVSLQIRVSTGNKRLGAWSFGTKASTTSNTCWGISLSLDTMTIGSFWAEALYFQGKLMPIDLGHMVVDDHGRNAADCGDL